LNRGDNLGKPKKERNVEMVHKIASNKEVNITKMSDGRNILNKCRSRIQLRTYFP
jgi:hypothetical protein